MHVAGYGVAADLHARGVQEYNRGTPARALRTLRRAADMLATDQVVAEAERTALAARIWISIALNECEVHSLDEGYRALATAESYVRQADDPAVTVLLHCQRGLIELRAGSLSAARTSLDLAATLIEHAAPRDQASILINRGTVALFQGRLAQSRPDLLAAAQVAHDAQLPTEEFKALHNLAYLEFLAGDLPRAIQLMNDAGAVDAPVSRGVWHLDRARVLAEAGLAREADDALAHAMEIFVAERQSLDLAEAELERARCALALGDVAGSRRLARRARERFERRANKRWRRAADLVVLQAEVAGARGGAQGHAAKAVELGRELAEEG